MAVVQGVKEKVHLPIYDSLSVESEKQLGAAEKSSTLRFFVNVQDKTKLETNLQSAGLLPHYNTFEARALRVVLSDLPPKFPDDVTTDSEGHDVTNADGKKIDSAGNLEGSGGFVANNAVVADLTELALSRAMELLHDARNDPDKSVDLDLEDDDRVKLEFKTVGGADVTNLTPIQTAGGTITLTEKDLVAIIGEFDDQDQPPDEQISPSNGAGTLIGKLIYNTVTTLFVGEKIMIQMPTWFFPSGAGAYSEGATFTTHGEPNPTATFRFAEPIFIDKQQNFRVEIEVPDADTLKDIQKIYGPMFIWVVLDGYMTRDVQ